MALSISFFIEMLKDLLNLLDSERYAFSLGNVYPITILDVIIALIAFAMVTGVFWRGAKG